MSLTEVGIRCVVLEVRSRRFGPSVLTVCAYDPDHQRWIFLVKLTPSNHFIIRSWVDTWHFTGSYYSLPCLLIRRLERGTSSVFFTLLSHSTGARFTILRVRAVAHTSLLSARVHLHTHSPSANNMFTRGHSLAAEAAAKKKYQKRPRAPPQYLNSYSVGTNRRPTVAPPQKRRESRGPSRLKRHVRNPIRLSRACVRGALAALY